MIRSLEKAGVRSYVHTVRLQDARYLSKEGTRVW
jgi:hypothetical protein